MLRKVALGVAAVLTLGASACVADSGNAGPYQVCLVSVAGTWQDAELTESARKGLVEAHREYNVQIDSAEAKTVAAAQRQADSWARGDCELIIGVGAELEKTIHNLADEYENKNFALVGSYFLDEAGRAVYLENGRPILFDAADGSFLAGYLAAGMSKTGKVAAFGGVADRNTRLYLDGFADGVATYNTEHRTAVELLGWNKTSQTGVFTESKTDEDAVKRITQDFIAAGADLIMPVTGVLAQAAVQPAAQAEDVWLIGTDGQWVPRPGAAGVFLTAVTRDAAPGVKDTVIQAMRQSKDVLAYVATLKDGGVEMEPFYGVTGAVAERLRADLDATAKLVISGKLRVESQSTPLQEGQPWRSE